MGYVMPWILRIDEMLCLTAAEQGIRKALLCACEAGRLCKADTARQRQLTKL